MTPFQRRHFWFPLTMFLLGGGYALLAYWAHSPWGVAVGLLMAIGAPVVWSVA